jgi:hypothetical protein
MMLLQEQCGFSQTPLGITEDGRIVSRQKFVSGEPPTQEAADLFEPWVGDARADNFCRNGRGNHTD